MDLAQKLTEQKSLTIAGAGNSSAKALILARLLADSTKNNSKICNIFYWSEDDSGRKKILESLKFFHDAHILQLPAVPKEDENGAGQLAYDTKLMRMGAMLAQQCGSIIVLDEQDFLVKLPAPKTFTDHTLTLKIGDTISFSELFAKLLDHGYHPTELALVEPGTFLRRGSLIDIYAVNRELPLRVELDSDTITSIHTFDTLTNEIQTELQQADISPLNAPKNTKLLDYLDSDSLLVIDELEGLDTTEAREIQVFLEKNNVPSLRFVSFPDDEQNISSLRFADVLRFSDPLDFTANIKKKKEQGWKIVIATRRPVEVKNVLQDQKVVFEEGDDLDEIFVKNSEFGSVTLLDLTHAKAFPEAFQNADEKILLVTDNEIFGELEERQKQSAQKISLEFLASLHEGDFVIHIDHGVGRFLGIIQKQVGEAVREYLELEYGGGDRLFVPVDQADRVSKYLGIRENDAPNLTRLGSAEWATVKKKVHRETQIIARDLLMLYAKREESQGFAAMKESKWQKEFDEAFPYEETPGQLQAIRDIYSDMAKKKPMDRLVCGDVGFGKTEVAMRSAFRAVMNGKQVAVLAPITILADQHFKSFQKRLEGFPVRLGVLTRFQKPAEQKDTLQKLAKGEIDIVVGTHRLLSNDVKFKNLGLLIIDEEQRFGVQQKERIKKKRLEVDVLTLTATPIPRTLNMSLNGLRDISTITTPPPGRLPVMTEVRKFSHTLIREAVMRELERDGQVYILHNRVETIDIFAEKMRQVIPEAKIIVAHGQLKPEDLERRIKDFTEGRFNILISSTIIENGIDLPRANTLIVDRAEAFGLAQLYQLRGRIGRGRVQAYAYFLYHSQRLQPDAKARLRAVMEATELGAGFQIAMRDLEIRGAGNILGAEQSGAVNTVGVTHFSRLLNQAVEDIKSGKFGTSDEPIEITLDLPVSGYLPSEFVNDSQQKIIIYQKLSSADSLQQLQNVIKEIETKYGALPRQVRDLERILELKILARKAGLINIRQEEPVKNRPEIVMVMSDQVKPKEIMKLLDHNPQWLISGDKLKIRKEDLGENWLQDLIDCARVMTGEK